MEDKYCYFFVLKIDYNRFCLNVWENESELKKYSIHGSENVIVIQTEFCDLLQP